MEEGKLEQVEIGRYKSEQCKHLPGQISVLGKVIIIDLPKDSQLTSRIV